MKKFLLLAVALTASFAATAQGWVKPEPTPSMYTSLSKVDSVYIYNIGSGLFLTQGNDWGTHASVGETPALCVVLPYAKEGDTWDGKSYKLRNLDSWGYWHDFYIEEWSALDIWANGDNKENYLFCVEPVDAEAFTYRFTASDANITTKDLTGKYVGNYKLYHDNNHDVDSPTGVIYSTLDDETNFLSVWAFITREDYAPLEAATATYNLAMQLQKLIEKAEGLGIYTQAAQAVFDNTSSTLEQLQTAYDNLYVLVTAAEENSATPDNPADKTDLVVNPDFTDGVNGWTNGANASTFEAQNYFAQFGTPHLNIWNAKGLDGKSYQMVTGLPNGIYEVKMYAFSNNGCDYVFAGDDKQQVQGSNGKEFTLLACTTDGNLELGMLHTPTDHEGGPWCGFGNVRLSYLGTVAESYQYWLNYYLEQAPDYANMEVSFQTSLGEEYVNVLQSASEATEVADIQLIVAKLIDLIPAMAENVAAYAAFEAAVIAAEAVLEQIDQNPKALELEEYLSEHYDDASIGLLSTEEIAAQTALLYEMSEAAIKASAVPGTDITNMIANPDFSDGKTTGWTVTGGTVKIGANDVNITAEVWQENFTISQEIKGLANGLYQLDFYGMGRTGSAELSWDNQDAPIPAAYAIVNNSLTALADYCSAPAEEAYADYDYEADEGIHFPTSLSNCAIAFKNGRYANTAYGVVTDGVLRIGITSTTMTDNKESWAVFDNFRLIYQGKDETALKAALPQLITGLQQALTGHLSPAVKQTVTDATQNVNLDADANTLYETYLTLEALYQPIEASMAKYAELYDAYKRLQQAYIDYVETASQEAFEALEPMAARVKEAYEGNTLTDEQIDALLVEVADAIRAAQGLDDATDEKPVNATNYIVNPNFDANINGWTNTGDRNWEWRNSGGSYLQSMQCYNDDWKSPFGASSVEQVIKGLPAGSYAVGFGYKMADANWETAGTFHGCYAIANNGAVELTESTLGGWEKLEEGQVLCAVGDDGILTIRFMSTADETAILWIIDNVTLTYFGKNSTVGIEKVNLEEGIANEQQTDVVYDLSGRSIAKNGIANGKLPKGVYIIGGKKVLVK